MTSRLARRTLLFGGAAVALIGATGFAVDEGALPGRSTLYRRLGLDGAAGVVPHTAGRPHRERHVRVGEAPREDGGLVDRVPAGALRRRPPAGRGDAARVRRVARVGVRLALPARPLSGRSGEGRGGAVRDRLRRRRQHVLASARDRRGRRGHGDRRVRATSRVEGPRHAADRAARLVDGGLRGAAARRADGARLVSRPWPPRASPSGTRPTGRPPRPSTAPPTSPRTRSTGDSTSSTGSRCGSTAARATGSTRTTATTSPGFTARPAGGFEPGAHDSAYWRRMAPAQLAFLAAHL